MCPTFLILSAIGVSVACGLGDVNLRILVVDDHEIVRKSYVRSYRQRHYPSRGEDATRFCPDSLTQPDRLI